MSLLTKRKIQLKEKKENEHKENKVIPDPGADGFTSYEIYNHSVLFINKSLWPEK